MKTENVFVGVDGGGTKSKLVMRDAEGKLLGNGRSGASNIRLSVDISVASIMEAFNQACLQASQYKDLSCCKFHLGLGLAGTEVPIHCTDFLAKLPKSFASVELKSDAYAACLGAHDGEEGAILIIGTGVVGYKISGSEELQVSGWGFPHDDQGGGAWIGMETVRHVLESQDGRCEKTPFLDAVMAQFSYDHTAFVTWANQSSATEFATLAPIFTQYLVQDDPVAKALAQRAGQALTKAINVLLAGERMPALCLFGGLASFMEPYLPEGVRKDIRPRRYDAAEGALMMVKSKVSTCR